MHQANRVQMPRRSWARRTKLGPLALHTSLRQAPSRAMEEKATVAPPLLAFEASLEAPSYRLTHFSQPVFKKADPGVSLVVT